MCCTSGQQTELKVKLQFPELDFDEMQTSEEWREKLLQHFRRDQGISAEICDHLQIELAQGQFFTILVDHESDVYHQIIVSFLFCHVRLTVKLSQDVRRRGDPRTSRSARSGCCFGGPTKSGGLELSRHRRLCKHKCTRQRPCICTA